MKSASKRATIVFLAMLAVAFCGSSDGADWLQFRGPGGRAQSDETGLPMTWSATENIAWKTPLPGKGASSPVTFGDRIYITCYTGYGQDEKAAGNMDDLARNLLCIDRATGKVLWNAAQPSMAPQGEYRGFPALHGYASGTPVVDADGIYVFYGTTGAAAFSHEGKRLWLTSCGTGTHSFGTGTSPALCGNRVIVNASVESDSLIGLDKKTGAEVWRQTGIPMSWNTPTLVATAAGAAEIAVNTKGKVLAFDPQTGERLWSCDAIDDYICPSILAEGDLLYAIGGRKNTTIAIRSGGRGDVTGTHKLWSVGTGSNVSSPVYHQGYLYFASEQRGIVYCLDAKDGKTVYEERLEPRCGKIYASPIVADGRLYYFSREEGAYVLAAKPEYQLLAHNQIEGDDSVFNGSPVPNGGALLVRSDAFLYCIGNR